MNTSDLPIIYTSSSREIEIHFTAVNMSSNDDPDNLNFEATYEFIKGPPACKELRKVSGGSGTISVATDDVRHFSFFFFTFLFHSSYLCTAINSSEFIYLYSI